MVGTPVPTVAALASLTTFTPLAAFVTIDRALAPSRVRGRWLVSLLYGFIVDFAFHRLRDIDAPARELRCQPCVLPIFADSQRELPLEHCDDRRVVGLTQLYSQRLDRAERVCHEGCRIRTPLDDINLLVVEFMHDVIDTRAAH